MRTPLAAAVDLWRSQRIVVECQQDGMSGSRLSIPRENLESSGISLRMNPIRKERRIRSQESPCARRGAGRSCRRSGRQRIYRPKKHEAGRRKTEWLNNCWWYFETSRALDRSGGSKNCRCSSRQTWCTVPEPTVHPRNAKRSVSRSNECVLRCTSRCIWLFFDVPRPVPVLGRWICLEAFDALEQSR